jgi:hypothetical protein
MKILAWHTSIVLNHMGQIALFVGLAVTLAGLALSDACSLRWDCADRKVLCGKLGILVILLMIG